MELPMRTRRTADDFVRDMRAKLHPTPGVAPVVTTAHRQDQRDRAALKARIMELEEEQTAARNTARPKNDLTPR
jgi:hypothetical protein